MRERLTPLSSSSDDSVEGLNDEESAECLAFRSLMAVEHKALRIQKASHPSRDNLHSSLFPWLPRASEPESGSVTADGPWRAALRNLGQGRQCSKVPLSPPLSLLIVPAFAWEDEVPKNRTETCHLVILSSCHLVILILFETILAGHTYPI